MLHSKVAMKGHGIGNKRLQHDIVDLFPGSQLIQTDEPFTVNGRTHTLTHTHTHTQTLTQASNFIPRTTLLTIYTAFVRPHLDYGDILYAQAFNNSFHDRPESVQCNTCLAITGSIRGSSGEKLYQTLGLEPLRLRI